jgi:hypothetical protein
MARIACPASENPTTTVKAQSQCAASDSNYSSTAMWQPMTWPVALPPEPTFQAQMRLKPETVDQMRLKAARYLSKAQAMTARLANLPATKCGQRIKVLGTKGVARSAGPGMFRIPVWSVWTMCRIVRSSGRLQGIQRVQRLQCR